MNHCLIYLDEKVAFIENFERNSDIKSLFIITKEGLIENNIKAKLITPKYFFTTLTNALIFEESNDIFMFKLKYTQFTFNDFDHFIKIYGYNYEDLKIKLFKNSKIEL